MTFTCEQIIGMDNPYKELGSPKLVAENLEALNNLDQEAKLEVASRMVLGCPNDGLNDFYHTVSAAKGSENDEESFYTFLSEAYEVKSKLVGLMDERLPDPHRFLLDKEFDYELFTKYQYLALGVVNEQALSVALRLAKTTPNNDRSKVARNLNNVFKKTEIAATVGHVFTIARDIEGLLLSDTPYEFFNSRDFDRNACIQFAELFKCIEGKQTQIATKLVLSTPTDKRNDVVSKLNGIRDEGNELATRTRTAFALQRNIEQLLLGENPALFFSSRDFSVSDCLAHAELFSRSLEGKAEAIGLKLAQQDASVISAINRKLELMTPKAHDQNSPFRLIAKAMTSKLQEDSADEEEQDRSCSKLCGFF